MFHEHRWNERLKRPGGQDRAGDSFRTFRRSIETYSEPHRSYHAGDHIEACLSEFDRIRDEGESPDSVECALLLHDVVYGPLASDNEEKSSRWAMEFLVASGCP